MIIRNASREDSDAIAECLLIAMRNIVKVFLASDDEESARNFLRHFTARENNQYSYENCIVATDGKVVGAINIYDGARLNELRLPVVDYIRKNHNPDFAPEDETAAGEYYIDTLGVLPEYRKRGIGTKLLEAAIEHYGFRNRSAVGLLVDPANEKARRLYLNLGFQPRGTKTLTGYLLEHLQFKNHG